jgi:RNase adapter protein RapZ
MMGEDGAKRPSRSLIFITGLSGAGRSTALNALEDQGYEVVDNLPLSLLEALLWHRYEGVNHNPPSALHLPVGAGNEQGLTALKPGFSLAQTSMPLAVGIDARTRGFSPQAFLASLKLLREEAGLEVKVLFMDADDDVLQRRFTETRRRHPLAVDRPIMDGIKLERRLLEPLKRQADYLIDSSQLSVHETKRLVEGYLGQVTHPLTLSLISFAYRHGLPREADLVFDVRFLRNPHWDLALRPLTGFDDAVKTYIAKDPAFPAFSSHLKALLLPLVPLYQQEGKSYLTIAFGCSGGRHRSVAMVMLLADWVQAAGYKITILHRELADKQVGSV